MNAKEVYKTLRNYHWMIREMKRLEESLRDFEFTGTAQYGEEAAMPKAVGHISNPVAGEAIRRQTKSKRMKRMEEKVLFIHNRLDRITDEVELVVLDCLMDGLTVTAITQHMRIGRKHAYELIDSISEKLSE